MSLEDILNYTGYPIDIEYQYGTQFIKIPFSQGEVYFRNNLHRLGLNSIEIDSISVKYNNDNVRNIIWYGDFYKMTNVSDRFFIPRQGSDHIEDGEHIAYSNTSVINIWQFIYPDAVYHILPYDYVKLLIRKKIGMILRNLVLEILHIKKGE